MSRKRLLFFGCGGHSRSAADLYLTEFPGADLLFIDPQAAPGETLFGFPVLKQQPREPLPYFFALGDNLKRQLLFETIGTEHLASIHSSKAHYGKECTLKAGTFIGNFAHIGPQASLGFNTIVNNGAIVEHEVKIGNHSHIGPRAAISGRCKIGHCVFIGVGAVVKDQVAICDRVVIGAGAVVVKPIHEPGIYVGCPARKIKEFPLL